MEQWAFLPFPHLSAFVLGACIGSFLNVVIARLPRGLSLIRPGSHCPRCSTAIRWHDNIPLMSYLILRGRCRSCRQAISLRYPLVELITATSFAAAMRLFGFSLPMLSALTLIALLVALTFIDLDTWLLPDGLTLGGLLAALLLRAPAGWIELRDGILGAVLGGGFLLLVAWAVKVALKKEGMGGGDIKLLAMLGAFLGVTAVPFVLFLASLQGALVGSIALLSKKSLGAAIENAADGFKPTLHHVPFGPFLALGGLEYLFFSPWILGAWVAWGQWLGDFLGGRGV